MGFIEIRLITSGVQRYVAEKLKKLDEAERKSVAWGAAKVARAAMDKLRGGGADHLNVRTGALRDSLTKPGAIEVEHDALGYKAAVGFRKGVVDAYAPIQEYGGTVRPKNARVLTIPLPENLTAAGVARVASPRDVEGGFWRQGAQHPVFWGPGPTSGGLSGKWDAVPLFVGVPSVTIPERKPLRSALEENNAEIFARFQSEVAAALAGGT